MTSPDGIDVEYTVKFGFQAFNNEAEYEALIVGLNLAHSMEANQLEVCSDSQLVVKQIEDSYEARGKENDPLPQKGTRATQKNRTGLGQMRPKGRKFTGGCSGKVSNDIAGRPG